MKTILLSSIIARPAWFVLGAIFLIVILVLIYKAKKRANKLAEQLYENRFESLQKFILDNPATYERYIYILFALNQLRRMDYTNKEKTYFLCDTFNAKYADIKADAMKDEYLLENAI